MRQLHPVGLRERFVRRGTYRRLVDDKLVEQWTLHELDGAYLARVDREDAKGFTLYEALFDANGWPVRFNEEQFSPNVTRTRVHRVFLDGVMQTTTSQNAQADAQDDALPANAVPTDWPWIVQGLAAQVALGVGGGQVFEVSTGQVWPIEVTARHDGVQVVRVGAQRLWIDAVGVTLAAEDAAGERIYLDDGSSKSKVYASVE